LFSLTSVSSSNIDGDDNEEVDRLMNEDRTMNGTTAAVLREIILVPTNTANKAVKAANTNTKVRMAGARAANETVADAAELTGAGTTDAMTSDAAAVRGLVALGIGVEKVASIGAGTVATSTKVGVTQNGRVVGMMKSSWNAAGAAGVGGGVGVEGSASDSTTSTSSCTSTFSSFFAFFSSTVAIGEAEGDGDGSRTETFSNPGGGGDDDRT